MPDDYSFKDGGNALQKRAAKEIAAGIYANKDIEYLEGGGAAKTCSAINFFQPEDTAFATTLLEANPLRKGLIIANTSPAMLFIFYGAEASAYNQFTVLIPGDGYWEMPYPIYLGLISGVWRQPQGYAIAITELI